MGPFYIRGHLQVNHPAQLVAFGMAGGEGILAGLAGGVAPWAGVSAADEAVAGQGQNLML